MWKQEQVKLFQILKERSTKVQNRSTIPAIAGDGQCDRPGHSAKFGSYTLLELNLNKILDYKLVHVAILIYIRIYIS